MSGGYDLAAHDPRPRAEQGVEMPMLDPAGRPTGVVLRVRGIDAPAYQEVADRHLDQAVARAPRKITRAESEAEYLELHAALLVGWVGLALAGAPFPYSPENALRLLRDYPYILEQVRRFANNRANFLPGSATS